MQFQLSVRELVEFIYQSGDLVAVVSSNERAQLGSRIHRMLQAEGKGDYQSEVYLKQETTLDDIVFVIDGRADGIYTRDEMQVIEEIKTTAIPYDDISDQHFVHFAQVYCYAYIYAFQHQLASIMIEVTYYQIETKQIKRFSQEKTMEELSTFYMETLQLYCKWAKLSQAIKINSSTTLKTLQFPFASYRPGQRDFAVAVYKTILDKKNLFAQAPTGIGKTISTLFPALKAIGEGKIDKIFYLCAKNITASVAYDTLSLLYQQQVSFKTVGITAKDKICFQEERNCDPNACPYAKGYYNRNKDALYELLHQVSFMTKDTICEVAKKHTICPFELSLDASLYADVIVCDYNYLFDPRVYLKRFFMEKSNHVVLVDEAHNLVDRAREMYSASIDKEIFKQLSKVLSSDATKLHHSIQALLKEINSLKKYCEEQDFYADHESISALYEKVENFVEQGEVYLQSEHDETHDDIFKDVYFQAINYMRIADFYDENFVTWILKEKRNITVKQYCMNPSNPIREVMKKVRNTILFSATLSPIDYFIDLLGGDEQTNRLSLPSPFAKEQVKVIIHNRISTRFKQRDESLIDIIETIHAAVLGKEGNYIVFCPSYSYMKQIYEAFQLAYPECKSTLQEGSMKEDEKQAFLQQFETTGKLHVLFCVLGGMFSEGIDLKGERLLGAIIIGVGLPQINPQQDLIKNHFDIEKQMGFAYAYQFPGMNKVLQAAGRVIRSTSDKGIILFIDERFTTSQYRRLLPNHLSHYEVIQNPQQMYTTILKFWEGPNENK